MELSDNSHSSSKLLLNKNDDLFAFYNRTILNNSEDLCKSIFNVFDSEFNKTTNSIRSNDSSSDNATDIYNIVHLSLEKEGKTENQQASITTIDDLPKAVAVKKATRQEDKTIGCCCCCYRGGLTKSKSKTDHGAINHVVKMQTTSTNYEKVGTSTSSKFNDETVISISVPKTPHITDISKSPLQRFIELPMRSKEFIDMKDLTLNRKE
jgi:hypothetical protein